MLRKYARAISTVIASALVLAIIPWNSMAGNSTQRYIVDVVDGKLSEAKQELANIGLYPESEISRVSDALIVELNPNQVNSLAYRDSIESILPDQSVSILNTQVSPDWGLDRLDSGVEELDSSFYYPEGAGAGVRIYVVDTGVKANHAEFSGRVIDGYDVYGEDLETVDCNGHGTHVAGVAAGEAYGVAKDATIVPVRVLNCDGVGYFSDIIKGLEWIAETHPQELYGVVNISLGGYPYSMADDAIESLYNLGLLSTVAAGNFASDACNYSPARAPLAITVGSIDKDLKRSSFSNYGDCVDLYAPGFYVRAADYSGTSGSVQKSGTSQSAPFAAGVIATLYSSGLSTSASSATTKLQNLSVKDAVTETNSSLDNLLQTYTLGAGNDPVEEEKDPEPTPEPEPEQPEPTPEPEPKPKPEPIEEQPADTPSIVPYVVISETSSTSVTLGWGYADSASHYQIMVGFANEEMTRHSKRVSNTSEYTLNGLLPARSYWLQVVSYKNSEFSPPTERIAFTTEGMSPGAPREADVFRNILSWREPANKGGATSISYVIQKRTNGVWQDYGTTVKTSYEVDYASESATDLYRVVSKNTYGLGESTGTLYVRSKAPQITEPAPVEEPVVEGITIAQKQVGSAFVVFGWSALEGATKYVIEKSEDDGDSWQTAASTEKTEALTVAWLNTPYLFKVVAQMSDGSTVEVGSAEYIGK